VLAALLPLTNMVKAPYEHPASVSILAALTVVRALIVGWRHDQAEKQAALSASQAEAEKRAKEMVP
jgi:hypothetical protein